MSKKISLLLAAVIFLATLYATNVIFFNAIFNITNKYVYLHEVSQSIVSTRISSIRFVSIQGALSHDTDLFVWNSLYHLSDCLSLPAIFVSCTCI